MARTGNPAIRGNPKGTNRGGGWRPGQKSKKVMAREAKEREEAERQQAMARAQEAERNGADKTPKEVLQECMNYFLALAAIYQPSPGNERADEKKFEKYMDKAGDFAAKLAPYRHQRMPQALQVTPLPVDLSKLTVEELIVWERLSTKATAYSGGDTGGDRPALTSH